MAAGIAAKAQEAKPETTATEPAPAAAAGTTEVPAAQAADASPALHVREKPREPAKAEKGKAKNEYTGPTQVVELPPTPMLDEEGKQRVDPDGKPMFNEPVRQQRDKKGHPVFDEAGKPVFQTAEELGYDEHGKKLHPKKEKPPKTVPVTIARGTFTVDGMTGKAELNYDIKDLKYIYLYAPGVGTVVVSNAAFPGAVEEKGAFEGNTLTVTVTGHTLQLASEKQLLGKKPEAAFVALDPNFLLPSKYPVVGYGELRKAPYVWPGAKRNSEVAGAVKPPPTPSSLQPVFLLAPCPAGEMRAAGPATLPGEKPKEQPCVPIPNGKGSASVTKLPSAGGPSAASQVTAQ